MSSDQHIQYKHITHSLRVLQESLVAFLFAEILQELLPVSEHRIHMSLVFDGQLQSSAKGERDRHQQCTHTQVRQLSGKLRTCPSCTG